MPGVMHHLEQYRSGSSSIDVWVGFWDSAGDTLADASDRAKEALLERTQRRGRHHPAEQRLSAEQITLATVCVPASLILP